ncbi:MAG: hypothetical protein ACM3TR_04415 [Caulobacteraceae bacterium]
MGSYIEALELGAETIVSSGGHGPCRDGFYGETHSGILKNLGYDVDIIIFDDYKNDFRGTIERIKRIKNGKSLPEVIRAVKTVYAMAKSMDRVEKLIQRVRAYEKNEGECTKNWEEIQKRLSMAECERDIMGIESEAVEIVRSIPLDPVTPDRRIKIGIVGEIYVVMEQSINMKIEEMLETGIPVLTLSIDEQTGSANIQTRVEAFIDMIKGKKLKNQSGNDTIDDMEVRDEGVLYWNRRGLGEHQCGRS